MKITQTNGNSNNRIKGSRLSIWNSKNELVDQFVVPSQNAKNYCKRNPNGIYGKRLAAAIEKAS